MSRHARFTVSASLATAGALLAASAASAAFQCFVVVATPITQNGQSLTRWEVFARFDGPTDTVLNAYNLRSAGSNTLLATDAAGFWHKDNSDYNGGVLSQQNGTWAPQQTGSATSNRPFDSFLLIGGLPTGTNSTNADPSWGASPGWSRAQLPIFNPSELGWFNTNPPNFQGRVGIAPNTATDVKLIQFVLSGSDTTLRQYSLTIGYNNGVPGSAVQFATASFALNLGPGGSVYYRDVDGDGFGSAASGSAWSCGIPPGFVSNNLDCNDSNAAINPNTVWYRDLDGDGFGTAADGTLAQCTQPAGYALTNNDNCPAISNPTQADCDADGLGDACELAAGSTDLNGSGVPDECEFVVGGSGYATVQAAINAAPDGTTITIGSGNYAGAIDVVGKRVQLVGAAGALPVLDGTGLGSSIVRVRGAAASGTSLRRLVLRNGRVGSFAFGSYLCGGGALIEDTSVTIEECLFADNLSGSGGGLAIYGSTAQLVDCAFVGNEATLDGGGIEVGNGGTCLASECLFADNLAPRGAGANFWDTTASVVDSTFETNVATVAGGAVSWYAEFGTPLTIDGCTLLGNLAPTGTGLARIEGSQSFRVGDSLFCSTGSDDINGPFVDLGGNLFSRDCDGDGVCDATEIASNPALDTNTNGLLDACERLYGDLNLDGTVNASDFTLQLAYWGAPNPPLGDLDQDGDVDGADIAALLSNWGTSP